MRVSLRGVLLCIFFSQSLWAQGELTRVAIVDFGFDGKDTNDRAVIRSVIEKMAAERSPIPVMSSEEVAEKLLVKNRVREKLEIRKTDETNRYASLRSQLEEAKRIYLGSRFSEALSRFNLIFRSLDSIPTSLELSFTEDVLQYMASTEWFLKNERAARQYLSALLDLDPLFVIDSQRFPPPIISLFSEIKSQARYPKRRLTFRTDATEVSAKFLGQPWEVERGPDQLWSIYLPIGHPILGSKAVLLTATNAAPVISEIARVPSEIKFESILDQRYSTQGLYSVLNNSTPSPRFLEVSRVVGSSVIFLGDFIQDLKGQWTARAQWFDLNSLQGSVVVSQEGSEVQSVSSLLLARAVELLNPEGIRPEALLRNQISSDAQPREEPKTPYYKTWWFWTAMGVATVGAGVGGYYLFKPTENLRFRVQEAP